MTMRKTIVWIVCALSWPLAITANAQDPSVVAEICTEAGVCTPVDPATAIALMALSQIAKELEKDDPFGENNDLVKAIKTIVSDLRNGVGPNNDLFKALKNIGNDLNCGPGPNNDIIKFLNGLGLKIVVTGCN
jgi:hypothetical protein